MSQNGEPQEPPPNALDSAGAKSDDAHPPASVNQPRDGPSNEFSELREIILSAERAESQRFSLGSLFALMTFAAVVLGIGAYLPKAVFAGALGIATLLAMVVVSLLRLPAAIVRLGWWVLLVLYLIAIVSAIRG